LATNTQNLTYVFGANISAFQAAIGNVQQGLRNTGQQLKDFGSDLSAYVSLPLAALGGAAIKAFGDIQSLKNGLTAVTGSADETNKQFSRLTELAKLPGLGLKEVTKGSINLQVIGFSAEKAEKSIRAFGNAVATVGGGREQFERATYGLAQLANTDFPLGEDLNIIKDAIPQITPLLKEAFGSSRSDELAKMGVSSAQVVDAIVNGLSKLPPVTGGVNAAFENLKDGVFTNLADIGEIINKNLDISALVDRLIDGLSSITNWFKNLSPEIQKSTLIFAGLGVVLPPILVGLGVLISTILPALIGGFAALVSPVGLAVAAIAAAGILIVQNWDSVKEYFTSGEGAKFWESVKSYAVDLWDSLKEIFNSIKEVVTSIWDKFGSNIKNAAVITFDTIKNIVQVALGAITGIFKVWASIFKGDWAGAWDGIKTYYAAIWNGITGIIKNFVKTAANVLGGFFKLLGMDTIGNALTDMGSSIDSIFAKIQIPIKAATTAVKDFKKELTGVKSKSVTISEETTTTTTNKTGGLSKEDKKRQDSIKGVYEDLAIGLKQVDAAFGASFDEKSKKRIQEYQTAINDLIKNGIDPASAAIKRLQVAQQGEMILEAPNQAKQIAPKQVQMKTPLTDFQSLLTTEQREILASQLEFNDTLNGLFENSLGNGIGDAFSAIGKAFATGGNALEAFGGSILKSFGGFLSSFGDLLIKYGAAAVVKGKLDIAAMIPGAGIAAGLAAMGAGAALKLAAGAFSALLGGGSKSGGKDKKEKRTAFANGGIVSSPTNAVFGEYPSAGRGNPEIVTPLNNLKGMLSDFNGGGMNGEVMFRIQGDTLVGVLNNHNKRQFRTN
jgi:tape measure domain-containing protein